jgi:putative hydrolase of the HAD superfamily
VSGPITTAFFDFGGTLADLRAERPLLLQGDLNRIGFDLPRAEVERALQAAREWREQNRWPYSHNYQERTNHFVSYCAAVVRALGLPGDQAELAARLWDVWDTAQEAWALYADTRPCLEALASGGLRLGIISNWDKLNLPQTCQQLSIAQYFTVILSSAQANADKPDPAIFRQALEAAGAQPDQSLHVGDSIEADVRGAANCGIKGILLARRGEQATTSCPVIRSLADLPALIRKL